MENGIKITQLPRTNYIKKDDLMILVQDKVTKAVDIKTALDDILKEKLLDGELVAKEVELQANSEYIQWKYNNEDEWQNLIAINDLKGENGINGKTIKLRKVAGYIQWSYEEPESWQNLIALEDLKGQKGDTGKQGVQGPKGDKGEDGIDGKQIELAVKDSFIKWNYVGEDNWQEIVNINELIFEDTISAEEVEKIKEIVLEGKSLNESLSEQNSSAIQNYNSLNDSITEAQDYINSLSIENNIPQLRLDIKNIENGLKDNQSLSYKGTNILSNNSLDGRTQDVKVFGNIMYKKSDGSLSDTWSEDTELSFSGDTEGNKISIKSHNKNLWNEKYGEELLKTTNWEDSHDSYRYSKIKIYLNKGNYTVTTPKITVPVGAYPIIMLKSKVDESNPIILIRSGIYSNADGHEPKVVEEYTYVANVENSGYYYIYAFLNKGYDEENLKIFEPIFKSLYQIEYGDKKTDYQEYEENIIDIQLKAPLNQWDYIYKDNRTNEIKLSKNTAVETINGDSEGLTFYTVNSVASEGKFIFKYQLKAMPKQSTVIDIKEIKCDKYQPLAGHNWDTFGNYVKIDGNCVYFMIQKEEYKNLDFDEALRQFKVELTAKPATIYYQSFNSDEEVLSKYKDIDLVTYDQSTYIDSNNNVPVILDLKVPTNIGTLIQNTASEVNQIWDIINNFILPCISDIQKDLK